MLNSHGILWPIFAGVLVFHSVAHAQIGIEVVDVSPPAQFGASEIREALDHFAPKSPFQIRLVLLPADEAANLRPEGFQIQPSTTDGIKQITIHAIDPAGLMYGGLELAEVIRTAGIDGVRPVIQNPHMPLRGTKFNIPLDVRTPSYTDVCDAAQLNLPTMWDFTFWAEYIDTLARDRYNFISLWNLHPFPSLVKVPEYPDVALNDVWRSRVPWDEHYSLEGRGFVTETILADVEVVRELTIEQKIDFWKRVMAYGKSRNVDFYIITWNIFTNGTGGQYGITDAIDNDTTTDYFRRSVRELLLTYPDLAGIGLTTGENMPGADFQKKEDWAMATYGQGVLDALAEQPGRRITFVHRQHMARAEDIARTFGPLVDHPGVRFLFSFKYAQAHVYSATTQPFHRGFVRDLGDMRTLWTLRNDDAYYFRWGAPDFVRDFIRNMPAEVTEGMYFGSDQYVWGREFLQRDPDTPGQLELHKHWYQWLLWGRLTYNPELDNERLTALLANHFGISTQDAETLFEAWQSASLIYPETTGFHWGPLDFQWYIEACQSRASYAQNETGFHDVNRFINLPPHPESGCLSIDQFLAAEGRPMDSDRGVASASDRKKTPLDVAASLDRHATTARELSDRLGAQATVNAELRRTLADIQIVAELGSYYADKIRGATSLARHRRTAVAADREAAIAHLTAAGHHWARYTRLALASHKNPLWTNRVGFVDWKQNYQSVLDDIRIAGGDPADTDLPPTIDTPAEAPARPHSIVPASDPSSAPE